MQNLREMIKRHEGVRTHAYRCSQGYLTIGAGRNIDENGGLGLSDEEIDFLLDNDIVRCIQELHNVFPWFKTLNEPRQHAVIDLCFNIGLPKLMLFQKANKAMNSGEWETAAKEYYDSRWAKQVGARAVEVCEMIRTGEYQNGESNYSRS